MRVRLATIVIRERGTRSESLPSNCFFRGFGAVMACLFTFVLVGSPATAQVNVLTAHNDIARTGQNLHETILTPSNVNPTQFGKLFSQPVNGEVYGQPLYVSNLVIPGKGTHNVVYVTTTTTNPDKGFGQFVGDSVYAFDADTNGGTNTGPLWQVLLQTNAAGNYSARIGVLGTPVIDLPSQTMYVVSSELQGSVAINRLHALDITTGAEKFGAPIQIQGSVPGTGSGSVQGILTFDPTFHYQRPGLLFLNGVVYIAFGSVDDQGPWHGWIFSYAVNPTTQTLQLVDIFCTSAYGSGAGIWMGGAGLAAEVNSPAKPYGRMFISTGNGSYGINPPTVAGRPFSNPLNNYGMSMLDLDLTGGVMTVEDVFTPYNQAILDSQDGDLGSGGPILLPTQTLASGKILNPLVQVGKAGTFYILDRDNNNDASNNPATEYSPVGLGGFNSGGDQIVQEVETPGSGASNWGAGVWGSEAYWNDYIYVGGTNAATASHLTAYSFVNGVLSTTPTSRSTLNYKYAGPTPSVSANGATNGIVWIVSGVGGVGGSGSLSAFDATNLANELYSSSDNVSRDYAGISTEFSVPTITNGKVYVGAISQLDIYGLLSATPTAPAPVISPSSGVFTNTQTVTITDALPGATIYYTSDGSTPNANSPVYQNPLTISSNQTITAIASVTGYLFSAPASVNFTSTTTPANPVFSLASGTYTGAKTLTITDSTPGAVIYYTIEGYTIDGPTPTAASAVYTQPLLVPASETVEAVAIGPSGLASAVVIATYGIYTIDFSQGFTVAQGPIQFNGSTDLDDFRLQLTDGGSNQAGSAFFATPVNIQSFATDFTFQLSNPVADGMTFTIQGVGPSALGGSGGGLGYQGIPKSLAIKFDLYSNNGEGPDSTGLYLNGAFPILPAIDLSSTGINLHSGDYFNAHIAYDGNNLNLTLTDGITLATWSQSFPVNIPAVVGGNTAYVGFTAGTGGQSSSQKVTSWTYLAGPPAPDYPSGFTAGSLTLNGGAALNGTRLRLTDGGSNEARSAFFTTPVNVQQFSTSFQFQLTSPNADGFTFTIQNSGASAVGSSGGGLGYWEIPASVAVKFDLYSNAGEGPDSTGLYVGGAFPGANAIDLSNTGINLHGGDIFNAQLTYNGATLTVVITDTVTKASATQTYTVNISAIVGGPTAYVGFTGGTGTGTSIQDILSWSYNPVPFTGPAFVSGFPASPSQLTLNGGAALNGTRLRLTDGGSNEARSAFFNTPVNIQQFITSFDFQLTNPTADGFTFTIQNSGATAVGSSGGGLGYWGVPSSVAVKFDLFSNNGEGPDSTGMYLYGTAPIIPAIDLSSTGINLHSGDIFNAQLTYDGTTLTVVITDTATHASATQTYTVNIPTIVGGQTAYVGFTGGTGGGSAIQEILSWSYTPTPVP